MSKASDWAAAAALELQQEQQAMAVVPTLLIGEMNVTVSLDGGLHVDREAYLTADQAVSLALWITDTFGSS